MILVVAAGHMTVSQVISSVKPRVLKAYIFCLEGFWETVKVKGQIKIPQQMQRVLQGLIWCNRTVLVFWFVLWSSKAQDFFLVLVCVCQRKLAGILVFRPVVTLCHSLNFFGMVFGFLQKFSASLIFLSEKITFSHLFQFFSDGWALSESFLDSMEFLQQFVLYLFGICFRNRKFISLFSSST